MEPPSHLFQQYDKYSYKPSHSNSTILTKLKHMMQHPVLIITTQHRYLGRIHEVTSTFVSIHGLDDMFPVDIILTHIEAVIFLQHDCTPDLLYPDCSILNKK